MKELIRLMNKQVNVLKSTDVESLKDLIYEQVSVINDLAARLDVGRERYANLQNAYNSLKHEFNRQRRQWDNDERDFVAYAIQLENILESHNIEVK